MKLDMGKIIERIDTLLHGYSDYTEEEYDIPLIRRLKLKMVGYNSFRDFYAGPWLTDRIFGIAGHLPSLDRMYVNRYLFPNKFGISFWISSFDSVYNQGDMISMHHFISFGRNGLMNIKALAWVILTKDIDNIIEIFGGRINNNKPREIYNIVENTICTDTFLKKWKETKSIGFFAEEQGLENITDKHDIGLFDI